MTPRSRIGLTVALCMALTPACGKRTDEKKQDTPATDDKGAADVGKAEGPKADIGVDLAKKVLTIGTLNDESGPALVIGKPYANGKRLLAKAANEPGSGLLPDGWTLNLVERDHGYNPTNSVQEYKGIKDQVLFIGTSFGTVNTVPLQKLLERDGIVAFPASLSSVMAGHKHTPPLGPSYLIEAMRGMDFAVEQAGGADKVKAGIIYQKDDYGNDAAAGWKAAAEKHGVSIVSEHTVKPGDKEFAAIIRGLKEKGATHVLLAILPSSTGPALGAAAQMKYMPNWIGCTPVWIDNFFSEQVQKSLPPVVFTNFYAVSGLPYWGEKIPGMDKFVAAWDKYGKEMGSPNFYIMASYVQGLIQLEVFKRALAKGDVTRSGYLAALGGIKDWDAGGMFQPIDLSKFPYETSRRTRVLKPDFANKSWTEVAGYAEPKALAADPGGTN